MAINFNETIWFFDIDDTLINTAEVTPQASIGIYNTFVSKVGTEKATEIKKEFDRIFLALQKAHQDPSEENLKRKDEIVTKFKVMQKSIIEKYGAIKLWSRECFIQLALKNLDLGQYSSPEIIQKAANSYWDKLTNLTKTYKGVGETFEELKKLGRPIFLITSSDARLQMDEHGQFSYDPKHSENLKKTRIELLKEKGINYSGLTIGDPEDKPSIEFFEKGLKLAKKKLDGQINHENCVMVGDSFHGDLETPLKKLGFGLIVLFKDGQDNLKREGERYISVGNLMQAFDYLKIK